MKLTVIKENVPLSFHDCIDENGNLYRVDLFIDGKAPKGITGADLVGKTIEVDYIYPYLYIAAGPVVIFENLPEEKRSREIQP